MNNTYIGIWVDDVPQVIAAMPGEVEVILTGEMLGETWAEYAQHMDEAVRKMEHPEEFEEPTVSDLADQVRERSGDWGAALEALEEMAALYERGARTGTEEG